MLVYVYLGLAIIFEVVATSALKATEGFTRFWPSTLVLVGYSGAFYFLSLVLEDLPMGVVYAVWAGLGIALITIVSAVLYKQTLDLAAIIGITLIVAGVVVINLFSKVASH